MATKKPKPKPKAKPKGTPNIPPGSYDPILDANLRASERGLANLRADIEPDTGIQRIRAQDDYLVGDAEIQQAQKRAGEDYNTATGNVNTGYQRNLTDLLKARAQGSEDYGTSIAGVQRGFANLGTNQAGQQRKAGVWQGGAVAQAAQKRAANEQLARAPIDTAYQRFVADSTQTEGRLNEDKGRSLADLLRARTRGDEDLGTQSLKLSTGFGRQNADWTTQLQRAASEQEAFAGDTLDAKVAQFLQNNPGRKVPLLPNAPLPVKPKAPGQTITVGPGVPGTVVKRNKKKKTVTYSNSVAGP